MDCSPRGSSVLGIFPGMKTGVGCHFILQGVLLTLVSNTVLLSLQTWQADIFLPRVPLGVLQIWPNNSGGPCTPGSWFSPSAGTIPLHMHISRVGNKSPVGWEFRVEEWTGVSAWREQALYVSELLLDPLFLSVSGLREEPLNWAGSSRQGLWALVSKTVVFLFALAKMSH